MKNLENVEKAINGAIENLLSDLKNGYSDRFLEYLKFCSNFHNYSANNTLLIYSQMPNATKVAGFVQWKNLGFKVKGKSIRILAPQKYKYIEVEGERIYYSKMTPEQKKDKEKHREGITYKSVPVFDISRCEKLEGDEETTEFFHPLGNSENEQYESLKSKIENLGIEIIETIHTQGAEGISYGGTILIKESLDYNNKLLTLIHELAHELLDHGEYSDREETDRNIRELRAESISYIVGQYIGLNNPFSTDYLLNFKADEKEFKKHIFKIVETSTKIINLINED